MGSVVYAHAAIAQSEKTSSPYTKVEGKEVIMATLAWVSLDCGPHTRLAPPDKHLSLHSYDGVCV